MSLRLLLRDDAPAFAVSAGVAENRLRHSDDMSNAAWSKSGVSVTAVTASRPSGVSGVVSDCVEMGGTITPYITQENAVALEAGRRVTVSAYCMPIGAEARYVRFNIYPGVAFNYAYAIFDVAAGRVVSATPGVVIARTYRIGSWVRVVASASCVSSCLAGMHFRLMRDASQWPNTYTGDGVSGVRICAAQLEVGAAVTSHIPTTSAAAAGGGWVLPPSNVLAAGRSRVARTASSTGGVMLGTASAATPVSGVVLQGHNMTAAGWWSVELFSGPNQTGSIVFSGERQPPGGGAGSLATDAMWFAPVAAQSYRITLNDPFSAAGYVQACGLVLGDAVAPVWGFEAGGGVGIADTGKQRRALSGALRSGGGAVYRRAQINCAGLTEFERAKLLSDLVKTGGRGRVAVSLFAGEGGARESDHTFVGKVSSLPHISNAAYGVYGAQLVIEET